MNITSSAYEVNFIGLRSYIHRATKLTSFFTPLLRPICVRLLSQFSCMRNPLVRVPLSIPNGSRDHPEGLAQAFGPSPERVGEAFSPSAPFLCPSCLAKTEHSHPLGMVVSTHFRCGKGVKRGLKNGALPFNID